MGKQRTNKHITKKLTALLLSAVILGTSLPLYTVGNAVGENMATDNYWSPEPYFSEDAKKEGATAWFLDDGTVAIKFPKAIGGEKSFAKQNVKKNIKNYLIEISSLGKKIIDTTKPEEEVPKLLYTNMVSSAGNVSSVADVGSTVEMIYATFSPEDLADAVMPITRDSAYRFNVRITAIDDGDWFSEPIDALLTSVPFFEYDESTYKPIDETNQHSFREVARFEKPGEIPSTENTFDSNQVYINQAVAGVGAPDPITQNPTTALSVRIDNQITTPSHYDTAYSREAFDFYGAKEVWYWFDCSDVTLNNVSFRLRTNAREWCIEQNKYSKNFQTRVEGIAYFPNNDYSSANHFGYVFSTKGFKDASVGPDGVYKTQAEKDSAGVVKMQSSDGGWKNVPLEADGTINLDHFKGYIRIPIELFCAEEDQFVDTRNNNPSLSTIDSWDNYPHDHINQFKFSAPYLLNKKGTAIDQAYLIQKLKIQRKDFGVINGAKQLGNVPAIGTKNRTEASYTNAYEYSKPRSLKWNNALNGGTGGFDYRTGFTRQELGVNKEGAFKAIEDVFTYGFSVESSSADSVQHRFLVDNIMFYKNGTEPFTDDGVLSETSPGVPVKNYYNQKLDRASVVLNTIDKYIIEPSWTSFREIEYISKMITGFHTSFGADDTMFIDNDAPADESSIQPEDGMAGAAKSLNRLDAWKKYREAVRQCLLSGTAIKTPDGISVPSNATLTDLVPGIIEIMESLPDPQWLINPTPQQQKDIARLYQAYITLNATQIDTLGINEKKLLFEYVEILGKSLVGNQDNFVVGDVLAKEPYLPFCDFNKLPIGKKAYHIEDDYRGTNGAYAEDVRHEKGLVAWTTTPKYTSGIGVANPYSDYSKGVKLTQKIPGNSVDVHAIDATVEHSGYMNSKAAKITFNSNTSNYNNIIMTRDGIDYGSHDNMINSGGCGADGYKMGDLRLKVDGYPGNEQTQPPLSLIFYVDFTGLKGTEFNFTTCIYTKWDTDLEKCVPSLGTSYGDGQKYFVLKDKAWEQWASGDNAFFKSKDGIKDLAGYKGYIRIPLYHLKGGNEITNMMDRFPALLNNIYAIQFGISGNNLRGKSFIIDNVGFTYSKEIYTQTSGVSSDAAMTRTPDKTYEEIYGAKSNSAYDFENSVGNLDPYGDGVQFATDVNNLITKYNALTDYQKKLPSVVKAKNKLDTYADWINNPETKPVSINPFATDSTGAMTPLETLNTQLMGGYDLTKQLTKDKVIEIITGLALDGTHNVFPEKALGADNQALFNGVATIPTNGTVLDCKTDKNVRYPGFNSQGDNKVGTVNYEGLGFKDKDHVDRVLMLFEYGISRLSKSDQLLIRTTYAKQLRQVYNSAIRCRELEKTKIAVEDIFMGKLVTGTDGTVTRDKETSIFSIYKDYTYQPEGTPAPATETKPMFTEIARRNDTTVDTKLVPGVATKFRDIYYNAPYYAKISMKYGSVVPAMKNVAESVNLFLINSKIYNPELSSPTKTGLVVMEENYKQLNDDLTLALDGNKLLNADLWDSVVNTINDYDHLMPRFAKIGEIYTYVEHIRRKLPLVKTDNCGTPDTTISMTKPTNGNPAGEAKNTYKVTYSVDLSELDADKKHYLTYSPTPTTTGKVADVPYSLTFTITPVTTDKLGDATNGASSQIKITSTQINSSVTQKDVDLKPIELMAIAPNTYGVKADGSKTELIVDVKCEMESVPTIFNGMDDFDISVMEYVEQPIEGGTRKILHTMMGAKNPDEKYKSSVINKNYVLQYSIDDTYKVTFPAKTNISWQETPQDVTVDVGWTVENTNMRSDSTITVSVDDSKALLPTPPAKPYQLLLGGSDSTYALNYNVSADFGTGTVYTGTNASPQSQRKDFTIPQAEWYKGFGDYSTQLTYTVNYSKGTSDS